MLNAHITDLEHRTGSAEEIDLTSVSREPRRLWETDKIFRCPLMGMCLTVPEQKQVLKKAGISPKGKTLYEIHEILIGSCENQNRLSRKIENLLNRKFLKEADPLRDLDEKAFMDHWESAFRTGSYEAVLWAAATRQVLSAKNMAHIFGAAHMDMHQTAQNAAQLAKRLSAVEDQLAGVRKLHRDEVKKSKSLAKENAELTQKCLALESEVKSANEEDAFIPEKGQVERAVRVEEENAALLSRLSRLEKELAQKDARLIALEERSEELQKELSSTENGKEQFKVQARKMINDFMQMNRCDDSCPSFNLCRKRILLVGGITKMEALYRDIVEKNGGIFEYHDGYIKGGVRDLENRLRRADVVLCPVNCNSHGACTMVKNLGKKHKKPVHMLSSSSLSMISQAVQRTASP
ncbi:hypothetical protein SAMN02745216_05282 [Desulfatibacillum alkenivorans DSM 16219]|uniref:DUF2325 domain-containing protein n=1 Tax=Desulfatibacillum alkenivorans DSM 16219 TaxID=1121393 RepID=A0A1M7B7P1_9BACT|nr:DUF2325 domain-containing protein [Desulfatibacillum alkenivorans]SHL51000.1 hypothetical protein SAMN02745216_05282 [Desulfatibacillum alkenivorans DSM 16219]